MSRVAVLCLLAACAADGEPDHPVRWLDYGVFVDQVQPILAAGCGNPSCHGNATRPLAIYSPRNWRVDPARLHLPEGLTEAELEHNYTACCVFASEAERPEKSLLLLKPLGETAGVAHGGGAVFDGTSDRDYRAVFEWIQGGWTP